MKDPLTTAERIEGYRRLSDQISEMGITIGRLEKRLDEMTIRRDEALAALATRSASQRARRVIALLSDERQANADLRSALDGMRAQQGALSTQVSQQFVTINDWRQRAERAEAALALAEIKRQQWYEQSEIYFRSWEAQRQARERAEAALAAERGRIRLADNLAFAAAYLFDCVGEDIPDCGEAFEQLDTHLAQYGRPDVALPASSQAAPHEPPQGEDG